MDEKEKHINQKPEGNYPEPGVPAGDAWAKMKDMLDQEMPSSEAVKPGKYQWIKSLKFIIPAVIMLIISVIFLNYDSNEKTISADQIKLYDSVSLSKTNEELVNKAIKKENKENNNTKNDSSIQIIKTDSVTANSLSPSLETKSTNVPNAINSSFVKSSLNTKNENKLVDKTKSKNLIDHKKSVFASSKNEPGLEKMVKVKATKQSFSQNNRIEKSESNQTKRNKNSIGKYIAAQQNKFPEEFSNKSLFSEIASSTSLNDDVLKKALEKKIIASLLIAKSSSYSNSLKQDFYSIDIKKPEIKTLPDVKKTKIVNVLSKNIHAGLQWNINLPMKGYNQFFTGANIKSNQFYTLFIPGIWIEKKLNNGNGIMLKLNPYSQYFGNNKEITSSTTSLSDSLGTNKITNTTSLVKISGMSGGLQYSQRIYDKLSIGIGANVYWQNRALLNKTVSDSAKIVMSDSLYSVKETSIEGKYLNLYFVTTNLEVLYTWRMFQFGSGIVIPVTSMTGISDKKIRPVSGQLIFRWRFK